MFRVFGRVLLHETGAPIPNVIVAAFDSDRLNVEPSDVLARADRLGSAPTDVRGEFSIEFTEREFGSEGERRADIIVAVFGPDVALTEIHSDAPLYVSRAVRRESGAIEGYVIYLPAALLAAQRIPIPAGADGSTPQSIKPAALLAQRIERRVATQSAIRSVLAPNYRLQRQQRRSAAALLSRLFAARPESSDRFANWYVPPGNQTAAALKAARAAGINRLAEVTAHSPGIALRGSPAFFQSLGFTQTDAGWIAPPDGISGETFEQAAPQVFIPTAVRVIDLLEKCKSEAKGHEAAHDTTPAVGVDDTPPPALSFEEAFKQELINLIASLDGRTTVPGERPSPGTVESALKAKIKGGPADAPSFHDFHSLQIAWFDVWTSVIDGIAYKDLLQIYDRIVQVVPKEDLDADLAEIDELKALLDRLDDVVWALAAASASDDAAYVEELKKKTLEEFDAAAEEWKFQADPMSMGQVGGALSQARKFLEQELTELIAVLAPEGPSIAPPAALGLSDRLQRTLSGLKERLAKAYKFDLFAPDSYNFGIVTTFRQRWQPLNYQAGDLVATVPLAPGEKRTYTSKQTIKTARAQKEVERAVMARQGESTETGRSEAEIIRKATHSTNFKMAAEGGFNVGIAHAKGGAEFGSNQALESAETKRLFREAVRKASHEYRNERTLELTTENVVISENVTTGEISNPNNEITVTYLFYELQRLVEISERLHRVTPVVLFAFEVPSPDQIDESWLLAHDWILRRVLLDDELLPALDVLADSFAGNELAVDIRRREWETQLEVVKSLQMNESLHVSLRARAREELRKALKETDDGNGGLIGSVTSTLFGEDDDGKSEARRRAAQQVLNWVEGDLARAEEQLGASITALQAATEGYTTAVRDQLNRRTAIDRLRVHVKENILYYMQAIWLHEPPDQRYFRVYNRPIEWPSTGNVMWYEEKVLVPYQETKTYEFFGVKYTEEGPLKYKIQLKMKAALDGGTRMLHEVADIDNLLGFKGNYAMFPLKEHNAITLSMSQAFLDTEFGVKDPDPWGEIPSASEAVEIARCAWHHHETTDDDRKLITEWLLRVLSNQKNVAEEIIIPTGQLFIEALTGTHTLLEDFKLQHRAVDVEKARAEMVQGKLEGLRYAARVTAGELGDPEVQTQIVLPPGMGVTIPVPNPGPPVVP